MKRTIAIIGAGRVGRALGRALRQRGWRIGAVVTRSPATARAAARAIGGGTPVVNVTPGVLVADVFLIAVPDRAIGEIVSELARVGADLRVRPGIAGVPPALHKAAWKAAIPSLRGKIALHTSGSLSHAVLAPLRKCGAAVAAMHPMQTFGRGARTQLHGVVFGVEGDTRAVGVARRMARALGGIPVRVRPERKVTYHLSGGFAAQHLLTVLEAGVRILMDAGLTRGQATRALLSMARQTMENLQRHGPRQAWTGPVPRGDYGTVTKHRRTLRRFPPEYKQAYVALTRLAARLLARHPRKMLRDLDSLFEKN